MQYCSALEKQHSLSKKSGIRLEIVITFQLFGRPFKLELAAKHHWEGLEDRNRKKLFDLAKEFEITLRSCKRKEISKKWNRFNFPFLFRNLMIFAKWYWSKCRPIEGIENFQTSTIQAGHTLYHSKAHVLEKQNA